MESLSSQIFEILVLGKMLDFEIFGIDIRGKLNEIKSLL